MEQDQPPQAGEPQFDAADVDIAASDQSERAAGRAKGRRGRSALLFLILGIAIGAAGAVLGPQYAAEYLRPLGSTFSGEFTVGTVDEKRLEDERLVMRVSSADGVALAIFTTDLQNVDMLINEGDRIELAAGSYRPFMNDPSIHRVRPAAALPEAESAQAAIDAAPAEQVAQDPERAQDVVPSLPPSAASVAGADIDADQRMAEEQQMEEQLAELNAQIDALEQELTSQRTEISLEARQRLGELHQQSAIVRQRLDMVKAGRIDEWPSLRLDFEDEWDELQEALTGARSQFEETAQVPTWAPTTAPEPGPDPPR